MPYGYATLSDLLATDSQTVADYGEQNFYANISTTMDIYNRRLMEQIGLFVEIRSGEAARLAGSGAIDTMVVEDMDEFATPDRQHVAAGVPMGFPLRRHGNSIGWTLDYLEDATVADMAAQVNAAMTADYVGVGRALRRAIYRPTNNNSYVDRHWRDRATLPIKALINADSFPLPPNPATGATFDTSTHTHYLAAATLTTTALSNLIATVREHYQSGEIRVLINQAQETTVRGLTGFNAYVDRRIIVNNAVQYAGPTTLDTESVYDRAIGVYDGAEIWVKPWTYANYLIAYHAGAGSRKPLRWRQRTPEKGSFRIVFTSDPRYATNHPLEARGWMREFGIAPQERQGMVVLMVGDTTYAEPTYS